MNTYERFKALWLDLADKGLLIVSNPTDLLVEVYKEAMAFIDEHGRNGIVLPQVIKGTTQNIVILQKDKGKTELVGIYPYELAFLFPQGAVTAENMELTDKLARLTSWH